VDEPAFAAVATATCGQSKLGDDDTSVCALDVLSGSMEMTYLAGRAPSSPDEVAAGQVTMRQQGAEIGDRLQVTGPEGATRSVAVVGIAVLPGDPPGSGLITTPDGFETLVSSPALPMLVLEYAPDLERGEVERILADEYGLAPAELSTATPPSLLGRLELVRPTLVALAVFLAVLGVIGLLHFLMLSTTRRRQESAVLEAIGFVRVQRIAVVIWQALTIATIGVIVGIPLGVILGRYVWQESIDHLGIVDAATIPWLFLSGVVAATLLAAVVVGVFTGWRSAHRSPTVALRHE